MDRTPRAPIIRTIHALLSMFVTIAITMPGVLPGLAPPAPVRAAAWDTLASSPPGSDLPALDTDTARYTQQSGGLTRLQLYNSPVGNPNAQGWRLRDTTLRTTAGARTVAPADLPFAVRLATAGDAATLATLTNEDGVRLGVGLASIDGIQATTVTGQMSDGVITYTAVVSAAVPAPLLVRPATRDHRARAGVAAGARDGAMACAGSTCADALRPSATPRPLSDHVTATSTPTGTPSPTAALSPTQTLTATVSAAPSVTVSVTPMTSSPTTTLTATSTPTSTPALTVTASVTAPPLTVTASVAASASATATPPTTATMIVTATVSATGTLLPAPTSTLTSPVATVLTTPTASPTFTPSVSTVSASTATPLVSATNTPSANAPISATVTTPPTRPVNARPAPLDLALRPTIDGLDVRVVVHAPGQGRTIVFALAPDAPTHLIQETGGAIQIVRPIPGRSDEGTPYRVAGPEYIVRRPIVRDNARDPLSVVTSGPLTMTLGIGPTGGPELAVRLDPAWLDDPQRVFPVQLDLPIMTAWAALHTGVLATVASCVPATPAEPTDLLVGVAAGCSFHGQLRFDLSTLMNDTPIVAATLRLYTPGGSGPTAVQVAANVPASVASIVPVSWQPPSWADAPSVAAGAAGRGQSASSGSWQSWDVTDLVRAWVRDGTSNVGLTLASSGPPVLFSSPLDAGHGTPSTAPHLDITYAPRPAISAAYADGAAYVYGLAGTFAAAPGPGYATPCATTTGVCTASNGRGGTESVYAVNQVVAGASATPDGPAGAYLRLGVTLSCASATPGSAWWNSSDQMPYAAGPVDADPYNIGSVLDILRTVATLNNAAGNVDHLIPILEFSYNPACPQFSTPGSWYSQLKDFVQTMNARAYGAYRPLYIEIGNEVDFGANAANMGGGPSGYAAIFASAAQGVSETMQAIAGVAAHERTLTAGMLQPSVTDSAAVCTTPQTGIINVQEAQLAITAARQTLQAHDLPVTLGVAVHPYAYATNGTYYWRNLAYYGLGATPNACFDLHQMLGLWVNTYFPGLSVVFTETNVDTFPCAQGTPGCSSSCHNPAGVSGDAVAHCEGAYLADLYTYLYDTPAQGGGSYADASPSPIRVAWFRGNDAGDHLGLVYGGGTVKPATIRGLLDPAGQPYCTNTPVVGNRDLPHDFYWLRFGACY